MFAATQPFGGQPDDPVFSSNPLEITDTKVTSPTSIPVVDVGSGVVNTTGIVTGVGSDEGESASDVGSGVVGSGVGVDDGAEEMARRKRIKKKRRSVSKFHFFVIGKLKNTR